MQLKLKLFDPTLPVPEYQTVGAAGMDLYARVTTKIAPRTVARVPLNIAIQLPPGYWALLSARSSLYKKGLQLANGIGVGDSDYCGDNDEYQAALLNYTDETVTVERGDRLVQLILVPYVKAQITVVKRLENADRGGFGSTNG